MAGTKRQRSISAAGGPGEPPAAKRQRVVRDDDGFIRTIDDDEAPTVAKEGQESFGVLAVPVLPTEEEERSEKAAPMNNKFSFDMESSFSNSALAKKVKRTKESAEPLEPVDKPQQPWDFSALTAAEAENDDGLDQTTVDEKIAKQRRTMRREVEEDESEEEESDEEMDDESDESSSDDDGAATNPRLPGDEVVQFSDLGLSRPLVRACNVLGYAQPTPIQQRCLPMGLKGLDICGSAETGSGKTAAFALPILERLLYRQRRIPAIRVVALAPTRELAAQCFSMIQKLAQFTDITACLVVGGLSQKNQESALRARPDIVVATPGRILDHLINTQSVSLEDVEVLILDEADRLLDMGFTDEVEEIVRCCPRTRQTMLFSATISKKVMNLVKISLKDPVYISVNQQLAVAEKLAQEIVRVKANQEGLREAMLLYLCTTTYKSKSIIFCKAKKVAHRLKLLFGLFGLTAAELHGNLTQTQRLEALDKFRDGSVDFLIATDLASRGLDILGIQTVINFNLPRTQVQYVHRVGRTARAGRAGRACSLVGDGDRNLLKEVVKKAKDSVRQRKIDFDVAEMWKTKIDKVEAQVANILAEEREEREFRLAERDANKGINMIEHRDEILGKPKKTWFQNTNEKKESKDRSQLAVLGDEEADAVDAMDADDGEEEVRKVGKRQKKYLEAKKAAIQARRAKVPRKKRRRNELLKMHAEDGIDQTSVFLGARKTKAATKPSRIGSDKKAVKSVRPATPKSARKKPKTSLPAKGKSVFDSQAGGAFNAKAKKQMRTGGKFKSKKKYKRR